MKIRREKTVKKGKALLDPHIGHKAFKLEMEQTVRWVNRISNSQQSGNR